MTATLIAARGGSTRLPRKNCRKMNGVPLVGWAIIQSLSSHLIDAVFLSTDDDELESIGNEYGATVIRRPDWPDANQASGIRPMRHGLQEIIRRHPDFDTFISILPTGPLNKPEDFDNAIMLYRSVGADCITPMIPLRETCIYKNMGKNRYRLKLFDKHYKYLSQSSGWCITSPQWYMWATGNIESDLDKDLDKQAENEDNTGGEGYYFLMEPWQFADCDTLPEFEMGELLMEKFILKGRGRAVYDEYAALKQPSLQESIAKYVGNASQQ